MNHLLKAAGKVNFSIDASVRATIQNGDLDTSKPKIAIDININEIHGFLESQQYEKSIRFASWITKKINRDRYKVTMLLKL
jgi:hypothetical protein